MDPRTLRGIAFASMLLRDVVQAQKFPDKEIREITFEIGMLGRHGLDINDPRETHVLRALPGRIFSALELVCIMYAGFKRIEPGMDVGVDLSEEWGMAERVGRMEDRC